MSLNHEEMQRTSVEMQRHFDASGLTTAELGEWLGMTPGHIEGVIAMDGTGSPVDAWLVRDALQQAVEERGVGGEAGEWSVLTESSRRKARGWFQLHEVPLRPSR